MSTPEIYVPYEALALDMEATDESTEAFVRSLFPYADKEQIANVKMFAAGKILEGIVQGIELTDPNPMATTEAYTQGYDEGYNEAMEDAVIDEEGES